MAKRGRPPLPDDERRVHVTLRVLPETMAEMERQAAAGKLSRGEVVDRALRPKRRRLP